MDKNTFLVYKDTDIEGLTNEQLGQLYRAQLDYANNRTVCIDDPEIKGMWRGIKKQMDANDKSYADRCSTNKRIAEERERKKREQASSESTNVHERTRTYTSTHLTDTESDTDTDTDTDTESENDNEQPTVAKKRGEKKADPVDGSTMSEPLKDKLREWLQYKKERRENYKPTGLKSLVKQVERHEQESGSTAVISLIDECMGNQYKGIVWEKLRGRDGPHELTGIDAFIQLGRDLGVNDDTG